MISFVWFLIKSEVVQMVKGTKIVAWLFLLLGIILLAFTWIFFEYETLTIDGYTMKYIILPMNKGIASKNLLNLASIAIILFNINFLSRVGKHYPKPA